jgi:hypothetical protein
MRTLPQHDTFTRYSNVAKELRAAAAQIPNLERRESLLRAAREYDERASTAPANAKRRALRVIPRKHFTGIVRSPAFIANELANLTTDFDANSFTCHYQEIPCAR